MQTTSNLQCGLDDEISHWTLITRFWNCIVLFASYPLVAVVLALWKFTAGIWIERLYWNFSREGTIDSKKHLLLRTMYTAITPCAIPASVLILSWCDVEILTKWQADKAIINSIPNASPGLSVICCQLLAIHFKCTHTVGQLPQFATIHVIQKQTFISSLRKGWQPFNAEM